MELSLAWTVLTLGLGPGLASQRPNFRTVPACGFLFFFFWKVKHPGKKHLTQDRLGTTSPRCQVGGPDSCPATGVVVLAVLTFALFRTRMCAASTFPLIH